jgi:hypothetical protein
LAFALEPTPDANHSPPAAPSHSADPAGGMKEELEFFFDCLHHLQFLLVDLNKNSSRIMMLGSNKNSNSSSIPPAECVKNAAGQIFFNPTRSEDAAWTVQYTHNVYFSLGGPWKPSLCV